MGGNGQGRRSRDVLGEISITDSVGYSAKKADGQRSWERSKWPGKTRVATFQIASGPFGPVGLPREELGRELSPEIPEPIRRQLSVTHRVR